MLMPDINEDSLQHLVSHHSIVFVDFWASWCAPCVQFSDVYEKIALLHPDIVFASVNLETEAKLAEAFHVRSIPHLLIFKDNMLVYSEPGSMPESALQALVENVKKLDVSKNGEA